MCSRIHGFGSCNTGEHLSCALKGIDNGCEYTPVTICEDNQGVIALSKNPVCHQRCKPVDIKFYFVRSALNDGKITTEYYPTADMAADILTKPGNLCNNLKEGIFAAN